MVVKGPVIGNRLGEILREQKLSAYKLAKQIGRRPHVVRRVVTGERNAGDALKLDIAHGLGMNVGDIFYFSER